MGSNMKASQATTVTLVLMGLLMVTMVRAQERQRELAYSILEEVAEGTFVGNVKRDSRISDRYSTATLDQLRFRFLREPEVDFNIDADSGKIRTGGRIDRDTLPDCIRSLQSCVVELDVVALVPNNNNQFLEIIKVTVEIQDINDNWPHFPDPRISHQILESADPGNGFVIPTAIDPDSGVNSVQDYKLVSSSDKFKLDVRAKVDGSTDVRLVLKEPLDREAEDFYQVRVVAYDGGNPPKSGSVDVNIIVQDANDNDPMFDNSTYEVTIPENTAPQTTILRVHASDRDAGMYGQIRYGFSGRSQSLYGHIFGIKNESGEIFIKGEVDFENSPVYHLSVMAYDKGPDSIAADATVIVRVLDINDNAPEITVNTLEATGTDFAEVIEGSDIDTFVAHLIVKDPDNGRNGQFNCTLNDNTFRLQQMFQNEYKIVIQSPLDRETQTEYSLAILCQDMGEPPLVSVRHIKIIVTDSNDNTPVFAQSLYEAELIENNYIGAFITQVNATDRDEGRNAEIRYSLHPDAGDAFQVEATSGIITARSVVDREAGPQIKFRVIASDRGSPPQFGTATVVVNVQDVNDEKPTFTHDRYSFGVYENEPEGTEVGTVHAVDPDSEPYSLFTYAILPSASHAEDNFAIDPHTGRIVSTVILDREETPMYELIVMAGDTSIPPMSSTTTVTVHVTDKNDNPPVFEYPSEFNNTIHISNRVPKGYVVTKVKAVDKDIGDNANLTYYISEGNHHNFFQMDPTFGVITVTQQLKDIIDYKTFELQLKVRDHGIHEKYAFTYLNIVVNKSITFPLMHTGHILGGHNFTIVVSLACVSGLIMVCLVIAIVVIRRQDMERRNHKYNCRMEALKMLHATRENPKEPELDSTSSKALSNGSCSSDCDKPKKEVSFQLDEERHYGDCDGHVNYSQNNHHDKSNRNCAVDYVSEKSWPSTIDHRTLEHPQACSSMLNNTDPPPGGHLARGQTLQGRPDPRHLPSPTNGRPWALTQRELEVHQLLQMLKDQDADSAYSGEGSNTDSGRGASEEGENVHNNSQHNVPGASQAACGSRSLASPDDSYNQVVPQCNTLPNQSFSSNYSYSSQPIRMQTFAPRSNTLRSSSDFGSRETSLANKIPASQDGGQYNTGFVYQTPKHTIINGDNMSPIKKNLSPPQRSPAKELETTMTTPSNQRTPYGNRGYHGYHSDAETEETEASDDEYGMVQYSCSDMTNGKTPRRLDIPDTIQDDDATTTSGSYVVDPQDLCNEIDELFFKDMVV